MEFREQKSIYLQIADYMYENILQGTWKEQDRLPSIRELAVETEVNPNTVMRSFNQLQEQGVIYNQRGVGYFVADEAAGRARQVLRDSFVKNELPQLFRRMSVLGIDFQDLEELHEQWREETKNQ